MTAMDNEQMLRLKVRLLTEGASLPEGEWSGRRGGAGPVGSRYFVLPNGRPCGVPIRRGESARRFGSAALTRTKKAGVWLYDGTVRLTEVPRPAFYDLATAEGVPYSKIALLHGNSTLATTVYQSCRYWQKGNQCRFCTIASSYLSGDTLLEKTPDQIAEVLRAAEEEGVATDMLLTTGTPDTPDMGAEKLIAVIRKVREISKIPIGVQLEPPQNSRFIDEISAAGANAIGLHIESADEEVRAEVCPGKYGYGSVELYRRSWLHAVGLFGRGNVSTFLLYGLGEDRVTMLNMVNDLASSGVMPVVTPCRPAPGSHLAATTPTYVDALDEAVEFYKRVGQILADHGLNPAQTSAGCHRCGGCSPIQEAYDWALHSS